ncbi:hypothetical protein LTS18_011000, partial [Coniosporium uncinatum]
MDQAIAKATGKTGRRRLGDKQKILFAPMSDVGGVLVDKDAVYIDVKTATFNKDDDQQERGLGEQMVVGLQGERRLLGEADAGVRLFSGGEALQKLTDEEAHNTGRLSRRNPRIVERGDKDEEDEDEGFESGSDLDEELPDDAGSDEEDDSGELEEADGVAEEHLGRTFRKSLDRRRDGEAEDLAFADSDSDLGSVSSVDEQELEEVEEDEEAEEEESFEEEDADDDEDGTLRWKEGLAAKALSLHGGRRPYRTVDLARQMYNDKLTPSEVLSRWRGGVVNVQPDKTDGEEEDEFFKKARDETSIDEKEDRAIPRYDYETLESKWADEANLDSLRQRFAATSLLRGVDDEDDAEFNGIEDDDEGDGAFEDLETGQMFGDEKKDQDEAKSLEAEREKNARKKEELKLRFEEEDREGFANDKANARREGGGDEEFGEDEWYDAQKAAIEKQLNINRAEFEQMDEISRRQVEGFRAGTYCRLVLEKVPYEFSTGFNPKYPVIIGGLAPTENRFGFVQVRIKRHRWHKKVLKTNDPLIFSLGWRRFQSMPIYSIHENRMRH